MEDRLKEILERPYMWVLIPDEKAGRWSACIREFPGCCSDGKTSQEAVQNLRDAAESWLLAVLERGQDVPEPDFDV